MAQPRLTDFFSRSKRTAAPRRASKPRTRSSVPAADCSSAAPHQDQHQGLHHQGLHHQEVQKEFLRVIEEAVGPQPAKGLHSPASPKRSAEDATFDLGAAVFSATIDHSSAKKRRPADPTQASGPTSDPACRKKSARKKLVLLGDVQQDVAHPLPVEQPSAPADPSPPQDQDQSTGDRRSSSRAMGKDQLCLLKARIQKIKKQSEDFPNTPSPTPAQTTPPVPTGDALKLRLARAKELAAKAQRRKEREAADGEESEEQPAHRSETPSYQRYHSLAQAGPPTLCLPYSYRVLAEMFRSMDTVVAMLFNRRQTPTFTTIRQGVQDMMHRRFEETHVAQIKNVFPEAFVFRQEKNVPTFSSSVKKSSYQLTVEPLLPPDQSDDQPVLSASRLLERRRTFHSNLLSLVKRHHKDFLSSLVPPLSVPEDKLTRWHPRFKVDSVPPVQASALPQAPPTERTATAQEVLDKARSLITPKMEKALVSLTLQKEDVVPQAPDVPQTAASPAQVPTALKGVSQCLLDRVRAKEAQKLQVAMTRDPQVEDRLLMMSRLAELARILRSVFVSEKKPALIMEVVCSRMVDSYRSAMTTGEMEKHVRLLAELAPDWLSLVVVRKDSYLKLNRTMELSVVLDRLTHRQQQEELSHPGLPVSL